MSPANVDPDGPPVPKAEGRVPVSVIIPYGGGHRQWLTNQLTAVITSIDAYTDTPTNVLISIAANSPDALIDANHVLDRGRLRDRASVVDATAKRGPSFARNSGVNAANADKLLFCDADDVVDLPWVQELCDALDESDIAIGVHKYDAINTESSARGWVVDQELPSRFGHLPFGSSSAMGVRGDVFARIGGFDESLRCGEDLDLCWRAQYSGATIALAPDATIQYRLRPGIGTQFVQTFRYGIGDAQLMRRHRKQGARRSLAQGLKAILGMVHHSIGIIFGPARQRSAYRAGYVVGHIFGSVRYQVWVA